MRNWDEAEEKGNQNCSAEADFQDAQRVCKQIGIPLHEVNFVSEYWNQVFVPFLNMVSPESIEVCMCGDFNIATSWALCGLLSLYFKDV